MILEFATKRGANGYRKYLGIDTDKKVFSRERSRWYCRADIVEITDKDRRAIIDRLSDSGFTEVDRMEV